MAKAIKPIIGTPDDDVIEGSSDHELISGRGGDDTIYSGNGHDVAWGGAGNDLIYGNSGNDVLWGSGGPSFVDLTSLTIQEDYEGQVIFEGETAGYRNSLGSYKVDENGLISDVRFHFPNASLQGSGGDLIAGVSSSELMLTSGDQIGFFILANGYSVNGGYNDIDLETGNLEFRNSDGTIAGITSVNPELWFVGADGGETELLYHAYHTAAGTAGNDYSLNPDSIAHTVGLLNINEGEITLGFEDLFNGGDRDFDDSVFTIDIGEANARVLDPNIQQQPGVDGGSVVYTYAYDTDGNLAKYDQDGNFVAFSEQNDVIYGGVGNDEIHGRAGNDELFGDDGLDLIFGGSGNDVARGGTGADILHGGKGDDSLYGDSGDDEIFGGSGHDHIDGGMGSDTVSGGSGSDTLIGGSGSDQLNAGGGDDHVEGGSDSDVINGGAGEDSLYGDNGNDQIDGGTGADSLYGGVGEDTLEGRSGDDYLDGGTGNDVISGGVGSDTIYGGSGRDIIKGGSNDDWIDGGPNGDTIDGGSGIDTVSYANLDSSINIDIHAKRTTGGDSDSLKSIENAIGSAFDDTLRGNKRDNQLEGGAGNDSLRGMTGQDTLIGGAGIDTFIWRQTDLDAELDQIIDFSLGEDKLSFDVDESLVALELDQWLSFEVVGSNTRLLADLDADGDFSNALTFVELQNVELTSLSEVEILVG